METTPKEKINQIVEALGISPEVQAKAMKVSVQTIYNKNNPNVPGHSFNEKNYQNLIEYLEQTLKTLKKD